MAASLSKGDRAPNRAAFLSAELAPYSSAAPLPLAWSDHDHRLSAVDTVRKVAELARIREPEARLAALAGELSGILAWIEQLNEVDVDGVEPMTSAVAATLPMRDDVVTEGGDAAAILANAPKSRDGFFVVPKVVE